MYLLYCKYDYLLYCKYNLCRLGPRLTGRDIVKADSGDEEDIPNKVMAPKYCHIQNI